MLRPGTIVANRFEIEHLAGKGGMGAVYRARDRKTGVDAAVKVVHEEASTAHHERLVREAQLLAELQHPSIVRYLALGTTDRGWPYLAMEWLEGEDLAVTMRGDGLELMTLHGPPEEGEISVRLTYARALHATGDAKAALAVIADVAQRVTAAAERIDNDELRRSFLEAVPEHALALALARSWRA